MAVVSTNLRNTRESARQLRVEPTGAIIATDVQEALEALSSTAQAVVPTPVAASPYDVLSTDSLLYVDTSAGPVSINLQAAAARLNRDLSIKDISGNASTNPISVVPSGAEKIDNLAPYPINADYGGVHIKPTADGYTVVP